MRLQNLFRPELYLRYLPGGALLGNFRSLKFSPPGHFYSSLLDIQSIPKNAISFEFDGPEYWENVNLRPSAQQQYYADLVRRGSAVTFSEKKISAKRFYLQNDQFAFADAFALSTILLKERPARVIEVGSGFSSAVMLDTADIMDSPPLFCFVEPFPKRLESLLNQKRSELRTTIYRKRVQELNVELFDSLDAQDILFIDSSHVAKIGSDLAYLFLRVIPRLRPGVLIHLHDIFYPCSYPMDWIRQGRAWNESLFLRAMLVASNRFEVVAFNSYAAQSFPALFESGLPRFLENSGGSIWLRVRQNASGV